MCFHYKQSKLATEVEKGSMPKSITLLYSIDKKQSTVLVSTARARNRRFNEVNPLEF